MATVSGPAMRGATLSAEVCAQRGAGWSVTARSRNGSVSGRIVGYTLGATKLDDLVIIASDAATYDLLYYVNAHNPRWVWLTDDSFDPDQEKVYCVDPGTLQSINPPPGSRRPAPYLQRWNPPLGSSQNIFVIGTLTCPTCKGAACSCTMVGPPDWGFPPASLNVTPSQVYLSRFPHKCSRCGGASYNPLFGASECAKGCK
jgi:hypothetical protein